MNCSLCLNITVAMSTSGHFTQEVEEGLSLAARCNCNLNGSHLAPSRILSFHCFEQQWGILTWGSKEEAVDSRDHQVGTEA